MSYLVLARKYRSRDFEALVGQEHVVKALSNASTQQRLHHAYLFTGTRGVGKTSVSRILAKALNCTGPDGQGGITAQPCGVCNACRDIDSGRFVDYVELDAASNRGVEEISQLLDQAVYKPVVGRFKVYMIDEVHMLSNTAFNAMLKTLEEPPEYLKFVLATTDPQKVPPTVLSRCLQFNLRPMAPQTVQTHLAHVLAAESIEADAGALRLLSRAARGSMRDALSLTDQAIAFGAGVLNEAGVRQMLGAVDRSHAVRLVEALAAGDGAALIQSVDGLRSLGLSASGTLEEMAALLQQMAVLQAVPDALDETDPDAPTAARLAGLMAADETQLLYSIVLHGRGELGLAPDEYSGLVMVLLRMLAFKPGGVATAPGSGRTAAGSSAASATRRDAAAVAAATPSASVSGPVVAAAPAVVAAPAQVPEQPAASSSAAAALALAVAVAAPIAAQANPSTQPQADAPADARPSQVAVPATAQAAVPVASPRPAQVSVPSAAPISATAVSATSAAPSTSAEPIVYSRAAPAADARPVDRVSEPSAPDAPSAAAPAAVIDPVPAAASPASASAVMAPVRSTVSVAPPVLGPGPGQVQAVPQPQASLGPTAAKPLPSASSSVRPMPAPAVRASSPAAVTALAPARAPTATSPSPSAASDKEPPPWLDVPFDDEPPSAGMPTDSADMEAALASAMESVASPRPTRQPAQTSTPAGAAGRAAAPSAPSVRRSPPVSPAIAPADRGAAEARATSAHAEMAASTPAPAALVLPQVIATPFGDRWAEVVDGMVAAGSISALVRELAMQAECVGIVENNDAKPVWRLKVERETLRAAMQRDKLQAALSDWLKQPVQIETESGVATDSPALRASIERIRRQAEAEHLIHNDPLVLALMQQYKTARIVPGSIKPH